MRAVAGALMAASHPLPEPKAAWTIPIAIVLALIAVFALVKKVILLALLAAIVAAVFFAYQGGAFDHYVDKGKTIINQHTNGA